MRLTLRTMLAFLDDVLEGPDAKELEQKIDESKFASDLVHRIRGSVRRMRLGAPKLDGKGMGADANTVAEYLDNTMPPERVPDFEKVCLESDVQLAEVAACHQVLTIVLGEPAAVDPAIRDRMYRVGQPGAEGAHHAAGHDGNGTGAPGRAAGATENPQPTKSGAVAEPEAELARRRPTRSAKVRPAAAKSSGDATFPFKSLAITLLLFFVVTAVALRAIAPINSKHPLWVLFAGESDSAVAASSMTADPAAATGPVAAGTNSKDTTTEAADTESSTRPSTATNSQKESAATTESGTAVETVKSVPRTDASSTLPAAASAEGTSEPISQPTTTDAAAVPSSAPLIPATGTPAPANAVAGAVPKPIGNVPSTTKPSESNTTPVIVARYISEGQVLTRLDAEKEAWMVLPSDTPLSAGETVLSLPTYRPQVLVAPTVKLTLAGEAFVKFHVADAANTPRVTLDFGRVILVPVGEMVNGVQVDFGGRGGQVVFDDLESVVAVEVRPTLPLGADPRTAAANLVVQMWATTGGAEWREQEKPGVRLAAGQRLQFMDESPPTVMDNEEMPGWIDGKNLSDIDRRASQELRKFLTTDRPLALSLLEQTNYRQVEVRALSCRSLCYLDIFEPAIAALGDSQHKSYWNSEIEAIQSVLPFGPDSVGKLQTAIDKLYGKDSERILRILQGYSPEQLVAGGAAELVDSLEHDLMAIRVVAFLTLTRITDKTQLFRPDERPEQEKSKIVRWRKLLEDGQIVYKNPPMSVPAPTSPEGSAK